MMHTSGKFVTNYGKKKHAFDSVLFILKIEHFYVWR